MAVVLLSPAVVDRVVGQVWSLQVEADELPALTVTLPDGTTLAPAVLFVADVDGWYLAEVTLATPGRYLAAIVTSDGSALAQAFVSAVTAPTAFPDGDMLDAWLGGAGAHGWSDPELQSAVDVEAAAQRRVCRIPAAYPPDLREALLRRAARSLNMRRQMTEQPRSDGGDYDLPPTAPPGRDAEVRRLEAPFRKVVLG